MPQPPAPKSPSHASAPSPKIAAIRAFIKAGYTLIPLKGKVPTRRDWPNTKPEEYDEKILGATDVNYGVALGDRDLVVDIDPRNFVRGDAPIKRLVADIGAPLESFVVRTGGGGLHIYFRKAADVLVVNSLKAYPGIEFKSAGRQVVGPGSIHPGSGKTYEIASGTPDQIQDVPSGLLSLIKRTAVPFAEVGSGTGAYKNDAATQSRFISYLQEVAEPSVEGRGGDVNAFRVACFGRDLGLPPATTWNLMLSDWNDKCTPPWDAEELKAKVIHAYKYASGAVGAAHPEADFEKLLRPDGINPLPAISPREQEELAWVTTKQGGMVKCFQNLLTYLRYPLTGLVGVFGFNEFTGRVEFTNPAPWHRGRMPSNPGVGDNDLKLLKGHLAVKHGFEMPVTNIEEAVTITGHANRFHPVREYLTGLKWDGTARLDLWLTEFLGVEDSAYARACSRKVLCAAVMRVMKPGCKFDHVLVLEGAQDIGKSTVCQILAGEWSADFPIDPHRPDTIQLMQGKWIIELAEMEVTRRADRDALKAFISRTRDEARFAYGRIPGEFPRQSIFIASKNPNADGTYLEDETGNRRWWPVACAPPHGQVNFKAFKAVRNQLWAEAVEAVKKGEHLYMETSELKNAARGIVQMRHAEHAWTERVSAYIHELDTHSPEGGPDFLTARDVYIDALGGIDKQLDRRACTAIAGILRELGWEPGHKRIDGRFCRGYRRKSVPRTLLGPAPALDTEKLLGDLL